MRLYARHCVARLGSPHGCATNLELPWMSPVSDLLSFFAKQQGKPTKRQGFFSLLRTPKLGVVLPRATFPSVRNSCVFVLCDLVTLSLQPLLFFFRFPCFLRVPIFLAFFCPFFFSKDFRGSAMRKALAFFRVSLAFFVQTQGLEGQGKADYN